MTYQEANALIDDFSFVIKENQYQEKALLSVEK